MNFTGGMKARACMSWTRTVGCPVPTPRPCPDTGSCCKCSNHMPVFSSAAPRGRNTLLSGREHQGRAACPLARGWARPSLFIELHEGHGTGPSPRLPYPCRRIVTSFTGGRAGEDGRGPWMDGDNGGSRGLPLISAPPLLPPRPRLVSSSNFRLRQNALITQHDLEPSVHRGAPVLQAYRMKGIR